MKVCFLILSAKYEPWISIEQGPRQSWIEDIKGNPKYSFFFYYGIPLKTFPQTVNRLIYRFPKSKLWNSSHYPREKTFFSDAHEINVDIPERWDTMACKFISAVNLLLKTIEFDFLVKVNTTTFVNLVALEKCLSMDREYFGARNKGKDFASGWAAGYSRKAVQDLVQIAKESSEYKLSGFDDEVLGKLMSINGYLLDEVESMILSEENMNLAQDKSFIRIKSAEDRSTKDLERFSKVHKVLQGKRAL